MKEERWPHVMLDLETLDNVPTTVILAIGAVAFDPRAGKLGPEFFVRIDIDEQIELGRTISGDTLRWWLSQDEAARNSTFGLEEDEETFERNNSAVQHALTRFGGYLRKVTEADHVRVWGNGSDFDNAALASLHRMGKRPLPWKFWNNRCFRTLKAEHKLPNPQPLNEVKHDALSDAREQARRILAYVEQGGGLGGLI